MKTETVSGRIENAYGNALKDLKTKDGKVNQFLDYSAEYEAFATIEEVRSAGEFPSEKDILAFVNTKERNNARQKAMQATLDAAGYEKPTLETSEDLQLATFIKVYMAKGHDEATASQMAKAALGMA